METNPCEVDGRAPHHSSIAETKTLAASPIKLAIREGRHFEDRQRHSAISRADDLSCCRLTASAFALKRAKLLIAHQLNVGNRELVHKKGSLRSCTEDKKVAQRRRNCRSRSSAPATPVLVLAAHVHLFQNNHYCNLLLLLSSRLPSSPPDKGEWRRGTTLTSCNVQSPSSSEVTCKRYCGEEASSSLLIATRNK